MMRTIKRHGNTEQQEEEKPSIPAEEQDYDGLRNATNRRYKALRDEHLEEEIREHINNDMW